MSIATCALPNRSAVLLNALMKPVDAIRIENLAKLIKQHGGQRKLADDLGKAPAQISQWITQAPNSRTGTPRAMASTSAREIETALGLPHGWMDHEHSEVSEAPAPYTRTLPPDKQAIVDLWDALDADGRRTMLRVGNALAQPQPSLSAAPKKRAAK